MDKKVVGLITVVVGVGVVAYFLLGKGESNGGEQTGGVGQQTEGEKGVASPSNETAPVTDAVFTQELEESAGERVVKTDTEAEVLQEDMEMLKYLEYGRKPGVVDKYVNYPKDVIPDPDSEVFDILEPPRKTGLEIPPWKINLRKKLKDEERHILPKYPSPVTW